MFTDQRPQPSRLSRRAMLRQAACGFGLVGLAGMLAGAPNDLPQFPARARRVIFLFMHGGPSHMDTFDPKPLLTRDHGKPLPFKRPLTFAEGQTGSLFKSPWQFKQHGQSGLPISELFPWVSKRADDLCIVRSMVGDSVAHGGAVLQLHTGSNTFTRPAMGAWFAYGLGTENQNLPAYITIKPGLSHGGAKNWSSGFLPPRFQGTAIGHGGVSIDDLKEPIEHLRNLGLTPEQQRYELDMIQKMNRWSTERWNHDPELEGRIQQFELAFRMQSVAPEAFDISKESEATKKLYGMDEAISRDLKDLFHYDGGNLATYGRMVQSLDAAVGQVLDALEHSGLADNTIVVFTSDNGGERFSKTWPFVGQKTELLEGGLRVPALLRWPARLRPQVQDQVNITMDWVPTLLAAAGVQTHPDYPSDGQNLLPVLEGARAPVPRTLFWRYKSQEQRAVRRGGGWGEGRDRRQVAVAVCAGATRARRASDQAVRDGGEGSAGGLQIWGRGNGSSERGSVHA